MADLRTNYKDDILNTSVNTQRKYRMITNDDGTVSFEDVTEYSQVGDSFGAADINATNAAVNEANSNLSVLSGQLINGDSTCDYVLSGKIVDMDFNFMNANNSDVIKLPESLTPKSDVTRILIVRYSESSFDTANITVVIGADGYIKLKNSNAYRGTGHITYSLE